MQDRKRRAVAARRMPRCNCVTPLSSMQKWVRHIDGSIQYILCTCGGPCCRQRIPLRGAKFLCESVKRQAGWQPGRALCPRTRTPTACSCSEPHVYVTQAARSLKAVVAPTNHQHMLEETRAWGRCNLQIKPSRRGPVTLPHRVGAIHPRQLKPVCEGSCELKTAKVCQT